MRISDWSSDVCSSDLGPGAAAGQYQLTRGCCPRQLLSQWPFQFRRSWRAASACDSAGAVCDLVAADDRNQHRGDRKSVVSGKSVSVRVDLGCRRIIKKKKGERKTNNTSVTIK